MLFGSGDKRGTSNEEIEMLRHHGRMMLARTNAAIRIAEKELIQHGASRHPLVDALLDIRNALRMPSEL